MRFLKTLLMAGAMSLLAISTASAAEVKIGFIVKQPEEPWFQDEWKFAEIAAKEKGFTLLKSGAEDGEKALAAIDNLGVQGAQGVIICTPDVKLGPGLVARAKANQLKLMTVDDQLVNSKGKPLENVPHMGISPRRLEKPSARPSWIRSRRAAGTSRRSERSACPTTSFPPRRIASMARSPC